LKNASTFFIFLKIFFRKVRKALFYAGFSDKIFLKKLFLGCLKWKNNGFLFVGAKKESVAKDTTLSEMTE